MPKPTDHFDVSKDTAHTASAEDSARSSDALKDTAHTASAEDLASKAILLRDRRSGLNIVLDERGAWRAVERCMPGNNRGIR